MIRFHHSAPATTLAFLFAVLVASNLCAAEYFVNKQGSDTHNGVIRGTAFLTIQKGVDALQPGDTLTIGPGEYFENVQRTDLGSMDVDTVIRAEVPGTALLRGDVPAPEFKKVDGYRFVYAAKFDRKPNAIFEHNTMHTLVSKPNVTELEFDPGFFHYDVDAKMLYISNLDLSAPDQCRYTVSVKEKSGLILSSPKRVIIEGLAATGFHPGWGILLLAPVSCVVRDCVTFMNVGGVMLQAPNGFGRDAGGSNNVVENCVAYGNNWGGIVRYAANNDVIRNCYTYKNIRENTKYYGIMHYLKSDGPLLLKNNISWGHSFDYSVKPNRQQERLENCVGLGYIRIATEKMSHNLIGGGNEYDRGSNAPADTVLLVREKDLDQDFEYADPLNLDFHLQPDSRFRGTAPDGSDRGPYRYQENIFYVSPAGDDGADGLSMRSPWRTLRHAFENLHPGDTIYLDQGKYAGVPFNKAGDGESPIRILGRGRGTVVITEKLNVTGGAGIVFERLNFAGGASLADSRDLTFKNCTFYGATSGLNAEEVENLKVTHSMFARVPLELKNSSGVHLSGNLYANAGNPAVRLDAASAIRYSDYNNYQDTARSWEVNGATWSFADLQERHDRYSQAVTPELAMEKGVPRLVNSAPFQTTGPNSTALGIHHEYDVAAKTLALVGPFLHSASDTTANIEWWTTHPATFSLSWGETAEMKNTVRNVAGPGRFNTFSLTGLKPGKKYYFKIFSADGSRADSSLAVLKPEDATLSFKTAATAAEPRVYYVAPDGDDGNDGLSREKAFRTLCHAAAQVGPGDTVLIAEGEYIETVRIRAAGTEDRPITFRCITGEKAVIQSEGLERSFEVVMKPDLRFDGLYFRGSWREVFVVRQSPRVQITRCLNTMVSASQSPEMLVRNCVLRGGVTALALGRCPDSVVENNVFIMTLLRHLTADASTIARQNIFCECIRHKAHQTLLQLSENVTETDNCFYVRWPEDEKLVVNNLPLPIYRVQTGTNSIAANPMMPGTPGWNQGWQKSSDKDFDEFFSTNPELILRGIGLQPEAFSDFKLGVPVWPYDRAWAEKFVEASNAAEALAQAGRNAEALVAYVGIQGKLPMSDRLKSDVLEKASLCAQRLKNYDQAMQLAKDIPVAPLAMHRQMQLMLEQKQYAALVDTFSQKKIGPRYYPLDFRLSFTYPEQVDVMADLYYYRALAFIQTGNLEAAEADLKIMRSWVRYRSGEAIRDLTWLRLGDFYRTQLKDDDKALDAYLNVCKRTTLAYWGTPEKPVLTGDDETLAKATEAACDILRKQGNLDKVKGLQDSLAKAQADAAAALVKE